jgi:hypothetical protein
MFHSSLGVFYGTEGIFCATDTAVPDELRVVVASLAPTSSVYVRVLTAGTGNDVSNPHNADLLAARVVESSVTDGAGVVAVQRVTVESAIVASGTFAMYRLQLARSVVPYDGAKRGIVDGAEAERLHSTSVARSVTAIGRACTFEAKNKHNLKIGSRRIHSANNRKNSKKRKKESPIIFF